MKTFRFLFARVAALGLLLGLPATLAHAQSPNLYDWAWVSRLGSTELPGSGVSTFPPSFDQPESLAADAAGNVIVAGVYRPDVVFGGASPHYNAATALGSFIESSYVAKYTAGGTLAWSLDLTSNGDLRVRDVAADASGNVFVLGFYSQQLRVDGTVVALASTSTPCFLAKISPAGALAWAITLEPGAPGTSRFTLGRLALDDAGNSAVQGEFNGQVTINGTTFAGAANKLHGLVLRYSAQGAATGQFAVYTTGSEQYRAFTGIALAPTGESYVSGNIASAASLQFGTLPAISGPAPVNGLSYNVGFIVKLDATTTPAWVLTTSGAPATGQGFVDIAAGPQGQCYALGGFGGGTMMLGPQSLSVAGNGGGNGSNIFLARVASSGTIQSLVGGGGTGKALALALGTQGEATILTAGGLNWGNVHLPGAPWPSSFLAGLVQLDAAGVPQRGWQAGLPFSTAAMAVDGLNRPVLAGTANAQAPYTFGSRQLSSPYAFNTLIARTATTALATLPAVQVAGLEVYPNPARRVVEVRTAQAGPVTVQLLDALGRSVRTQPLGAGQTQVDLGGVAPGSYTLLVRQGEARSYRRLVVAP